MRILVLSDSHRDKISLMMAVKLHREADVVVFLGDGEEDFQCEKMSSLLSLKEVHSVRGNCDVYSSLPSEETFACGGCHNELSDSRLHGSHGRALQPASSSCLYT